MTPHLPKLSRSAPSRTGKPPRKSTVPRRSPGSSGMRCLAVWGILVAGLCGLGFKLIDLQVVNSPDLRREAQLQQRSKKFLFYPRRSIVDRQGQVLAVDRPRFTLYAHPVMFKQSNADIARLLSPILGISVEKLIVEFSQGESGLEIEYSVAEDTARQILSLYQDGLELIPHQQRIYPQEDLMSEVVGYVNQERHGQGGVEAAYEDVLERSMQAIEVTRTGEGEILPNREAKQLFNMDALQLELTLDSRLQRVTRLILAEHVRKHGAKRGTVIVLNAEDGAILSLVQYPSFDANTYYESDLALLKNWAVTDLYEPGSTFKPINVAIALESGEANADQYFYDDGRMYFGEWIVQNADYDFAGGRGSSSLTDIIRDSSNVGMVRLMQQLDRAVFYEWLEDIGLSAVTGVDLPGETASFLKDKEQFVNIPVEAATAAFGQGFSLTPLKLAQLHASLANGGFLVTPHVVKGLRDRQGQLHYTPNFADPVRIFSEETTTEVIRMMEAAVDSGSGTAAQIPNYRVAGKTGTAQKASSYGTYYQNAKITSFVGILPDGPHVVLAVVDEPQGAGAYGGTVAAPIVKSIMESLIPLEKIPPMTESDINE
ncbi:peptidoglycan D,D-transpeptidase FtsI family protein [Roseofilum casamattae]|uniref:Penicillin-binding protein 2 n=1 Tax=Roseofilum casamattae BLCC-M143 TaxID=3022442 RepID=A0ABT7BWF9_9CYAN|nr:penicillin-binding protein 2 [Roseofilum casamattae]MDJ1182603.1 penicillin-binding protein 2 [Roseofilum casamattae BLCC-M143]